MMMTMCRILWMPLSRFPGADTPARWATSTAALPAGCELLAATNASAPTASASAANRASLHLLVPTLS